MQHVIFNNVTLLTAENYSHLFLSSEAAYFSMQALTNTQNIPLIIGWTCRILSTFYSTVYWV